MRRRRGGRGRRHGEHVARPLPAAQGPHRLPHGQRRTDRRHDPRRPVGRVQQRAHGHVRRPLRGEVRLHPQQQDDFAVASYQRALEAAAGRHVRRGDRARGNRRPARATVVGRRGRRAQAGSTRRSSRLAPGLRPGRHGDGRQRLEHQRRRGGRRGRLRRRRRRRWASSRRPGSWAMPPPRRSRSGSPWPRSAPSSG